MSDVVLKVDGLGKAFARNGKRVAAVSDASFSVGAGETLGIVGPSGSGKSTLSRLVLRLIEPDAGSVRFDGGDLLTLRGAALRSVRQRIQMVFQDPLAAFNPRAEVAEVISDPLRIHRLVARVDRPAAVAHLLDRVGLPGVLAERAIHEISGGQRQRVAIARALASQPKLIVLDEAVSALDVSVRAHILRLLVDLQAETGVSYMFVSHDIAVVKAIAHRVAIMDQGRIVETGPTGQVIAAPQSPTGKALVAAVPRLLQAQD
ncbi:peptide ABC transporter ATP-binding protein [Devosia epidermidihirudinis]|uniref:Peptide ABC transporter ATP-binding protein n=1 Tax=Devosia epidermidihirudinis TaxID=1293439 RepID=A0A0F5Q6W4_9HYPH|nr:ATP-binding cassette domain-containing protein [Devosia epidermidihirudinis]KKC36665.1 peptide ABC transporter ATP-binding protein [Devosia epidermidihirudinis]